jgi:PAS domain S-box-containing protein
MSSMDNNTLNASRPEQTEHVQILVIDDDVVSLQGLSTALQTHGYPVDSYQVPHEAIQAYKDHPYDLVITDFRMPGMNGIEVLQALRLYDPSVRIVVITGYADIENTIAAVNNGAYAFFQKPLDFEELLKSVTRIEKEIQTQKQKHLAGEQIQSTTKEVTGILESVDQECISSILQEPVSPGSDASLQARLESVANQTQDAIIVTDIDGVMLYVNSAFEQMSGFSSEEVIGSKPNLFKSGHHDEYFYKHLWETVLAGDIWHGRIVNRRKDGTVSIEETSIAPVHDSTGAIVNFVSVKHNVTQEASLQEQLARSQRLEIIGTLVGGMTHDFNNTLALILPYAKLIQDHTDIQSIRKWAEKIEKSTHRAKRLVQQLLGYIRQDGSPQEILNIEDEIADVLKTCSGIMGGNVVLSEALSAEETQIKGNSSQIHQIMLNLIINSRDAIPDNKQGEIVVSMSNTYVESKQATAQDVAAGKYVKITVADNGVGIDASILDKIFEPLFTTKSKDKGTGLGLAMVQHLAVQHKGFVEVQSQLGDGA